MTDDIGDHTSTSKGDTGGAGSAQDGTSEEVNREDRPADGYQPSQQWIIWAIMFGILILAVVLTI